MYQILIRILKYVQIVAFLIPLLDDKFPLIRSISCWTVSRFSKYIVQVWIYYLLLHLLEVVKTISEVEFL